MALICGRQIQEIPDRDEICPTRPEVRSACATARWKVLLIDWCYRGAGQQFVSLAEISPQFIYGFRGAPPCFRGPSHVVVWQTVLRRISSGKGPNRGHFTLHASPLRPEKTTVQKRRTVCRMLTSPPDESGGFLLTRPAQKLSLRSSTQNYSFTGPCAFGLDRSIRKASRVLLCPPEPLAFWEAPASPAVRMFSAALMSRSWVASQRGQSHDRTESGLLSVT